MSSDIANTQLDLDTVPTPSIAEKEALTQSEAVIMATQEAQQPSVTGIELVTTRPTAIQSHPIDKGITNSEESISRSD